MPTSRSLIPSRALRSALSAVLCVAIAAGGCTTHVHRVGLGPNGIGTESARQFYLFFGLVSLNDVDVQRMASDLTSYSIETRFGWLDLLLAPLLLPFTVTSRTVTIEK